MLDWQCSKCQRLYLVEMRPNSTFSVSREDFESIDFYDTPQVQAAPRPICTDPDCLGYLFNPEDN